MSRVSPERDAWYAMKRRCLNKHDKRWKDYGGRGISICARWLVSFDSFIADMGKRPSAEYSLDRKNNNGNYEPDNCKWATKSEQQLNKRSPRAPWRGSMHTSSKYIGVFWDKCRSKWAAMISDHGKRVLLGRFVDECDAATAYNFALLDRYGEHNQITYNL